MRIPHSEHTNRPWRIHQIAPDFAIEDVWAFRTPGAGRDDFHAMVAALRAAGGPSGQGLPTRVLFAIRWRLGALLGWDDPRHGTDKRVRSLRERLPTDLRDAPLSPDVDGIPFTNVYELDDEYVMELANKTVHDILHLGWVPTARDEYELRMAALVKPNGLFGRLYMAAIKPFRYMIIYPAMTRQWERAWRDRHMYITSITPPREKPDI